MSVVSLFVVLPARYLSLACNAQHQSDEAESSWKKKVPLELAPVGELLDNALSSQPIARLSSIDLELQYTPTGKKMNADHPATRSLTVTDFNSLIHVQPLVLPLKLSLKNFMKRFVRRNLLYQIPLVFNSEWRKVSQSP